MNPFESLQSAIAAAMPGLERDDIVLGAPPNLELGDVAVPMFLPAKKVKQPPPKLAAAIAEAADFGGAVTEVKPAGPYLNLKLDRGLFARSIVGEVLSAGDGYGSQRQGAGQRVLIEHTSINPNASPHVGRARNAMIGDSLTRLLRFVGYEVEVHYYVNDMGRQIGLLVLLAEELDSLTFDEVLDTYVKANERAKTDEAFAEAGYAMLARMEEGDEAVRNQFHAVTNLCLQGQLEVLARIGAQYDSFDHESDYVKDARLETVLAALREREAVFEDEDKRLVVDLSKLGYEQEDGRYFVLMRANGSSMYGFRDLAYTMHKAERAADVNLVVLGEDHKLYAQQCKMILEAAGQPFPEAIYYAYILLKDGKMSTRKGTVVLLSDFLDQAEALALERVREQFPDLADDEREDIARKVAVAAIRFAVLRVNANKNVIFDMETALSFSGDTGPYIQYSCARINSILRKHGAALAAEPADDFPADSDAEWALLTKIADFPGLVDAALRQRSCAPIGVYTLDLARLFTTFYHDCPVLKADTDAQRAARLQICRATLQTLTNALGILGIEAPERM